MSVLLWEQHNVGDAGFRSETRYQTFYRTEHQGPLFYVPIVAGTSPSDAVQAVAEAFRNVQVLAEPKPGHEFVWHHGEWTVRQIGALGVGA